MSNRLILVFILIGSLMGMQQCTESKVAPESESSTFKNTEVEYTTSMSTLWSIMKAYFTTKREAPVPLSDIPVKGLTHDALLQASDNSIFKLGHSSVLLKMNSEFVLFDPVFSERASPVQWAGPKRFHQPPIEIAELPKISAVVISHDHYDHLDKAAIIELNKKTEQFLVPLGLSTHLVDWGVPVEKIIDLNWWQHHRLGDIEFIATPTQHFSGRGLFDKNKTLWASWVVRSSNFSVYFSGDSGYFSGFKEIGEKFGPFDLTMIETGAYNDLWSEIHMLPEESLQAHLDLKGKVLMPIHNGTFDLALHDWNEPLERIKSLATAEKVTLSTPIFGEQYELGNTNSSSSWWQSVK